MSKGLFRRQMTALLLWTLSPALLAADAPEVFTGTLGRAAIVIELDVRDPERVTGRYFYQKYRHDLALEGRLEHSQVNLVEGRDRYDGTPRPELVLQRAADGWAGEWIGPQGKRLDVNLVPAAVEEPPAGAEPFWYQLHEESPYEFLRLRDSPLQPGKVQRFMGHDLQWWTEPVSGLTSFEVVNGYPQAQLDRINQQLRQRLRQEIISYHACKLGAGGDWGEFQQTVTPRLLSADLVSLSIFTSYSCGGAHPDFGDAPLTLDARTGEPLGLEDLLWVGEGPAFHYVELRGRTSVNSVDFSTYSRYRNEHFAPWLVEQWRTIAPGELSGAGDDDRCDYSDPEVWDYPSWYLSDKGIVFDPVFARVDRSCEGPEWPVLPYAVVKNHPGRLQLALPD
ncbi:MAG: hypothetical protein ACN6O6_05040 [Pseudomonas sp.]|uniref:hypothetical protein n=1 Tax=Pseudomonas sp. TaxID=306 RepID=UPI003D138E88